MNVPPLRFDGFEGEWKSASFQEICSIRSGHGFKASEYVNEGIPLVKIDNVGYEELKKNNISYLPYDYYEQYPELRLNEGDIVLALNRPITNDKLKISFVSKDFSPSILYQRVGKIDVKNSNQFDKSFVYSLLSKRIYEFVQVNSVGSDQPFISTEKLKMYNLNLPAIKEQKKIGDFLKLVSLKIEKQKEKIEKLEQFKKGMMQKIFSQELRFREEDGREFPEWKETTLGNLAEINTGNKDLQDAKEDGIYPFFVRSQKLQTIDTYSYDGEAILIPGDGNIGQIFHYTNGKFDFHQRVYKISDFKTEVKGKYIYYYLREFFLKEAIKNSVKATVDSLRLPIIKGMHIKLPHLNEQLKIIQVLTNLDEKIESEKEKLMVLEEQKRGFMQGMFVGVGGKRKISN